MDELLTFLEKAKDFLLLVVEVGSAVFCIYKWLIKPMKKLIEDMLLKMQSLEEDVGDLYSDRLQQAHDFYVYQQKWCSPADKQRLVDMHKKHRAKGRNHLGEHNEEEILNLPDFPADESVCG